MTLEEYVAHLNGLAFWREFTFPENRFAPRPGQALELADNLVWLGDFAMVLQLKQRESETSDPAAEATWFRKRVLDKAVSQVRDTLRFLDEQPQIRITNAQGHAFDIRGAALGEILKVIVFLPGRALPDEFWRKRFHVSQRAGFIHLVAAHDYLGILEKLRVPEDIRRYFAYRQSVAPKIEDPGVDEPDIMGAFLAEEELPNPKSRKVLARLVQDFDAFDLSRLIGNLHDHIETTDQPYDYYRIMLEFARVPRSVWRAIKERFTRSLEVAQAGEYTRPFRLTFPESGCTFMIAAFHPDIPATGPEGEKARQAGIRNMTYAAMYDAKTAKGVGVQVSKAGEYVQIDWCLMEMPWAPDPAMDAMLAESNPFRPVREKTVDSFFLVNPGSP